MSSVTAGSRKSLIWDALQETQAKLDALETTSSADKAKEARRLQLEDENGNMSSDVVIAETAQVKASFNSAFSEVGNKLEAAVTKLADVEEHIDLKDKELKEIRGIERSVNTLEALAKTQEDQTKSFNTQMSERKQAWTKEEQERNQRWTREEQDHRYEFERKMKIESNQLNDTLAEERKKAEGEIETRMSVVVSKENEVAEAIERSTQLEADMSTMVADHAAEVETAAAAAKKTAEAAANFKNTLEQKDLKNQIQMLQNNNTGLESQVAEKDRSLADLQNRLSAANAQLQAVAVASLGADALEKSNAALTGALDNTGKKR